MNLTKLLFKPVEAAGDTDITISTDSLPGATGSDRFANVSELITFTINVVFIIGLALALLFVIIGGIKYITSGGDEGKAGEARNTITNAVIGAVVIVAFRIILTFVLNVLGLDANIGGALGS